MAAFHRVILCVQLEVTGYCVYSVYTVYSMYSVYSVYTVYSMYSVYSVYTVFSMRPELQQTVKLVTNLS